MLDAEVMDPPRDGERAVECGEIGAGKVFLDLTQLLGIGIAFESEEVDGLPAGCLHCFETMQADDETPFVGTSGRQLDRRDLSGALVTVADERDLRLVEGPKARANFDRVDGSVQQLPHAANFRARFGQSRGSKGRVVFWRRTIPIGRSCRS